MNELVQLFLVNERIRMISGLAIGIAKERVLESATMFFSNIDNGKARCLAEKIFYSITNEEIMRAKSILDTIKK